jgi:hypothetical protein
MRCDAMNEEVAGARIYIMVARASDWTSLHARSEDGEVMHAWPSELCSWPPVNWFHMSEVTTGGPCTPVRLATIRGSRFRVVPSPAGLSSCIGMSSSLHTRCGQLNGRKEAEMDDRSRREDITCHIVDDRYEHLRFVVWAYGPFLTDLAQSQIELRFFFSFFFARFFFCLKARFNSIKSELTQGMI